MNRRKALWLSALSCAWLPASLTAQEFRRSQNPADSTRLAPGDDFGTDGDLPAPAQPFSQEEPLAAEGLPSDFPTERGQIYRSWDITRYTSLPHNDSKPESAIVEWIFRRTGSAIWHGENISVLSASRAQLRAYHNPKIIQQVEEIVERFADAQPSDFIKFRIRVVSAADTRWRYAVATRLTPVATGDQGQQVWTLSVEDAAMVRTQMQVYQGFKLLVDQEVTMINGQTLTVAKELDIEYTSGPQRDSAVGLGYQPALSKIKEGGTLRISPLLTYEGDAIDLALDLKVNTVQKLHPTKILTTREVGPVDMSIDVPEVAETRLNQTIPNWKLGQTLVMTAGIHPGVLQSKTGFMNLRIPGTVPTKTEVLVFLDAETVGAPPPRTARRDDGDTRSGF